MAKKDVHEAIDATMVPNGVKAINADSVRNLLHMMTDNAGEGGGGDGGVKVYALLPDLIYDMIGENIGTVEMTPESWAEIKAMVEAVNPGFIPPELDTAMEEAFAANAEVYKTMMQKAKDGVSTYAVIDFGKLFCEFIVIDMPEYAGMVDCSAGVLASAGATHIAGLDQFMVFYPSNLGAYLDNPAYDNLMLALLPNGGYIWDDMSGTSADYSLNIPVEGATLPEGSYKEENLLVRNAGYDAVGKSISIWHIDPRASAGTAVTSAGRYLIHEVIYLEGFLYFDGLELKKCMIDEEGNTTIAVVGSLNAPTA
jgi:hypothetical protein